MSNLDKLPLYEKGTPYKPIYGTDLSETVLTNEIIGRRGRP